MRTAEKDQNYLSVNKDSIVWFAGTDAERQEPGPLPIPLELLPERPKDWDSILKFSDKTGFNAVNISIAQGKENAIDINNKSKYLTLSGHIGVNGKEGEQVITIKGGSSYISIDGYIYSRGTDVDIEIGAWSDQSFDPSRDIDLSFLSRPPGDNRPITIVFGRVDSPIMAALGKPKNIQLPQNAKVLFSASIGEQIYWWAKWVGVKTGLIKGKK